MKPKKNYPSEVYLNGKWLKPEDAFISVFDRAFMFGDGIYEVTPFYKGIPFKLRDHLNRLKYCLKEVKIPFDTDILELLMLESLSRAGLADSDAAVYIQISRGAAPRTHHFPDDPKPTLLLYSFPVHLADFKQKRWKVLVSEDFRWQRCDIKSTALLANTMANEEAIANAYDESLLFRDENFTEGSHSTAFFVKEKIVYTHPEGALILSGITRKVVLEICNSLGVEYREKAISVSELSYCEEVFFTGTTTQITAVSSIYHKGEEVFRYQKGEITQLLQEEFEKMTRSY